MAQTTKLEGMIDSTPIMHEYADIETGNLPEYTIDSKIPEGPIAEKWTNYKAHQHLVNPANKRNLDIIVVGTGLAGASAASTLAEVPAPPLPSANWASMYITSVFRTAPAARTLSPLRVVSTPPRTIRTTATLYTVSSTIQ